MRLGNLAISCILAASAASAFPAINIAEEDCGLLTFYFEDSKAIRADLELALSLIDPALEATGMPRRSFQRDFAAACKADASLTIAGGIELVFKKYREILK